jgi:hypothetical protein
MQHGSLELFFYNRGQAGKKYQREEIGTMGGPGSLDGARSGQTAELSQNGPFRNQRRECADHGLGQRFELPYSPSVPVALS